LNVVRIYVSALFLCASLRAAAPDEWAGKAERLIRSGNSQQGLAALMKAAELPSLAEAHDMLGIVLKQTGELDAALPELKQAIRLDPSTPGPFNTLGQILRIKGDKQGSEEPFATGARLKREKEGQLADTLEQGMRGGTFPKPLSSPPR
jgi:Flp pilus assembly protein TadD